MRYFWSIFWFVVLADITAYVAGSMTSKTPDFKLASIVGAIAGLIVCLIGKVANIEPDAPTHH